MTTATMSIAQLVKLIGLDQLDYKAVFKATEDWQVLTNDQKDSEMEYARGLCNTVFYRVGTQREIKDVITYFVVLLDSQKYHLNWRLAKEDLGIEDIYKKYGGTRNVRQKEST